jgi:hypothetical protein
VLKSPSVFLFEPQIVLLMRLSRILPKTTPKATKCVRRLTQELPIMSGSGLQQ